ncbi:hypothetical protein KQX54_013675 [Cotesia glomerata]|uniref:EGF-like domain-containing protein n=1 Tax=Cotesia glomerata TaxID=32391 RepID=A0AAV7INZ5_COTGL|nr:hypothetical protein KQX54_013675 [Cotesia glomerata]
MFFFVPESDQKFCRNDNDCSEISNAFCVKNECQCKAKYIAINKTSCKPFLGALLGGSCRDDADCMSMKNAVCFDGICVCNKDHYAVSKKECAPTVGSHCSGDDQCFSDNMICIDNECQCNVGFESVSMIQCALAETLFGCSFNAERSDIWHAKCSNRNKCVCKENNIADGRSCLPLLGANLNQSCSINADCDGIPFAECSTAKTCSCRLNYIQRGSNQCLSALGEACSEHIRINGVCRDNFDCQDVLNTICTDNKCQCDQDSFEVDGKCVALLGGFCSTNSDCITGNSCIDHICQCSHNYEPIGQNSCKPKSIGKACKLDEDCDFIKNAKCADNVCQCRDKYFGKSDFLCSPIIGGRCSHKSECFFNNLECIDGQCQCSEGLSAISSSQCLTTSLMFSCQHVSECADTSHFECLNNKCVCKADDNISLSGAMCLPLLGGICWKNDQCIPENSACIDFKCQCNPGYIAAAKNLCVKI